MRARSFSAKDSLKIIWNDNQNDKQEFSVDIVHIDSDSNEKLKFEDCFVYDIKRVVAQHIKIKYDSIHLFYGKEGLLADDFTFDELKIVRGNVIHAYLGPYEFKDTKSDDIN